MNKRILCLVLVLFMVGCSEQIDSCMRVQKSYYAYFSNNQLYGCRPIEEVFEEYREQCKCKVRKNMWGINDASKCFEGYKEECTENELHQYKGE